MRTLRFQYAAFVVAALLSLPGVGGCSGKSAGTTDTLGAEETADRAGDEDVRPDVLPDQTAPDDFTAPDFLRDVLDRSTPDEESTTGDLRDVLATDLMDLQIPPDLPPVDCPADTPVRHGSQCVECISVSDCQQSGRLCVNHACVVPEAAPAECQSCAGEGKVCGPTGGGDEFACADCLENADCPEGQGCHTEYHVCCPAEDGETLCIFDPPMETYCQSDLECGESPYLGHSVCDVTQEPYGLCVDADGFCDGLVAHCYGLGMCAFEEWFEECVEPGYPAITAYATPGELPAGFCQCLDGWTDRQALMDCLESGGEAPACLSPECHYGVCVAPELLHVLPEPESICGIGPICVPPGRLLELLQAQDTFERVPAFRPSK